MAVLYFLAMVLAMKTDASRRATKEVEPYVRLQRQMHEALLREHPEWVQPNGECPMCEAYESRLAELLGLLPPTANTAPLPDQYNTKPPSQQLISKNFDQ